MRKLSPEKLKELRQQGVVFTEDGNRFFPKKESETPAPKTDPLVDLLKVQTTAVDKIVTAQAEMMSTIEKIIPTKLLESVIKTQQDMSKVIVELSKPKPPKNWHCTVSRDHVGKITTVDIAEK